jgi:hypothetical protein
VAVAEFASAGLAAVLLLQPTIVIEARPIPRAAPRKSRLLVTDLASIILVFIFSFEVLIVRSLQYLP